ncbi:MAG: hypothetical protein PWP31_1665 [Clostridia bacterium]|nr:hypothetical protein [Clostridia bacterium]
MLIRIKNKYKFILALFLVLCLLSNPIIAFANPSWQVISKADRIPLATGVEYSDFKIINDNYNENLKVININLKDKYTVLKTAVSNDNLAIEQEKPTSMAERLSKQGLAAVAVTNGDFYSTKLPFLPIGLQISNGELLISPQGFPAFGLCKDKSIVIGTPELKSYL